MGQNWGSDMIYGIVLPDRIYNNWNSHSDHGSVLVEFCEKFGLDALVGGNGDDSDTVEGLAIGIRPEAVVEGLTDAVTALDFETIEKMKVKFEENYTPAFITELVPILNKLLHWDCDEDFEEFEPEEEEDNDEERSPWEPDTTPITEKEIVNAKANLIAIAYYNV